MAKLLQFWVGCLRVELHAAPSIYLRAQSIWIVCVYIRLCVDFVADRHKNVQRSGTEPNMATDRNFPPIPSIDDEQINNDARVIQLVRQRSTVCLPLSSIFTNRLSAESPSTKGTSPISRKWFLIEQLPYIGQTKDACARYIIMNSKHEIMAFDLARFFLAEGKHRECWARRCR